MNKTFTLYQLDGSTVDFPDKDFPTTVYTWNHQIKHLKNNGTHFAYVFSGNAVWNNQITGYTYSLSPGMYCALPGNGTLWGDGKGIIITALDYKGMFSFGGPIESKGRLRYIDGCSDSLLIPPVIEGDPCLNALYFPPNTEQVLHTHPSFRAGIVVSGEGKCITSDSVTSLEPGMVFYIEANLLHSFRTKEKSLVVVAYHPTTDYGPTDERHPMIQATIVNGVPASLLPEIQTRL